MGACGSTPRGCVKVGGRLNLRKKRRDKLRRTRKWSRSFSHNLSKVEPAAPSPAVQLSFSNPAFQGNGETWFDTDSVIDSDFDEDFYSVQDVMSQIGNGSLSAVVSPRFSDYLYSKGIAVSHSLPKQSEPSLQNLESNSLDQAPEGRNTAAGAQPNSDDSQDDEQIKISSRLAGGTDDTGALHSCGLRSCPGVRDCEMPERSQDNGAQEISLQVDDLANCLPCLACNAFVDEKIRKSVSPRMPNWRRKGSLTQRLSFKRREAHASPAMLSPKAVILRPIAGSQIPFCPLDKRMSDCWSPIEPSNFKVRGRSYFRDKKKEFASSYAAFHPFGVDVFLSPRKIDHIARYVELPVIETSSEIPSILIVNLQIPLYPSTIFQSEYDGEGMSFVFYFKLAENHTKELLHHVIENIRKLISDEVERVRGFPVDTTAPFRERLKILGRIANLEELHLSATERKLVNAYNEKPVLSRPQHEFYMGGNYFEIDLDMHRFSYIARKGLEAFQERIKQCVLDLGLTIQGNRAEDLPEYMLCCIRLKEIDYSNCYQLGF